MVDEIRLRFLEEVKRSPSVAPVTTPEDSTPLYHYTTAEGLLGILQSNQLFATHAEFLNDASEFQRGIYCAGCAVMKRWQSIREEVNHPAKRQLELHVLELAERMLSQIHGSLERGRFRTAHYVTCFCERGDLLSMWRAYADGAGYCIAFKRALLAAGLACDSGPIELREMIYGDPPDEYFDEVVRAAISIVSNFPKETPAQNQYASELEMLGQLVITELIERAAFVKNAAFADEREWRAVVRFDATPNCVRVRARNGTFAPYIHLDFPGPSDPHRAPVRAFGHGPLTPNPDAAYASLRFLRDFLGYSFDIQVRGSGIPLRR